MELNTRKELLEGELAHQMPEINLSQKLQTADRWAVKRVLPDDAVLIEFVRMAVFDFQDIPSGGGDRWNPPHYVVFVLRPGEPDNVQMVDLGDAKLINQLIATFLVALTGTEGRDPRGDGAVQSQLIFRTPGMSTGYTLRKAIFDPLLPALGGSRYLALSVDGDLIQLPFAALPADDGSYLIDNYHFSYFQTGRDTLRFGVAYGDESSEPLVVADPDFDLSGGRAPTGAPAEVGPGLQSVYPSRGTRTFIRKPGTRTEGERISAMLGIRPWIGERALKVALSTIHSPRILHLAVPGFFVTDLQHDVKIEYLRPTSGSKKGDGSRQQVPLSLDENLLLRSGLAFSGANTWLQGRAPLPEAEDGLMTAEAISSLDLSGTELVVLSTCEISPVGGRLSEIIAGFQRAFLLAGAKILVMNVWCTPDIQTSEFMENFYRHILDGRPCAAALRQTQLDMKAKWPHPFYWGAFLCLGDLNPLPTLPTQASAFTMADDPYVVGLPAEGSAFVGRRDILAMIQDNLAPAAGKNILVLRGQLRLGKTSVLFRLRDTLAEGMHSAYLPVMIDMQGMAGVNSEGEFFFRMASEKREGLSTHGINVSRPHLSNFLQAPTSVFEFEFLDEVTSALSNQRILLMIDEFDKIKDLIETKRLRSEMLDYFRHLMQHAPLLFLIAGTQRLREFTGGYWTVFFNLAVPVDIGTLNEAETRWLITEPVRKWYTVETSVINEIVRVAGCHPYFTQLVCKKLLEVRNESRLNFLTMAHVEEAFNRALQSGDEQIGYPWTEKDCGDDERLILSIMASENKGRGPSLITRIQQRLNETGLAADTSIGVKRLEDRGVVRRDNNDQLSFVVPLFQRWIMSKHFDTLISAVQYNKAARASGIS
jgi:hypothetical protein